MADPGPRPVCSGPDVPRRRPPPKRFGSVVALDDLAFEVPHGPGLRVPRRQRRRQDDDDADHARRARAGRGPGHAGAGVESHQPAALDVGLPAGGARPVSADARAGAARVLRRPPGRAARTRARREALAWLRRFRAEDLADRRAEQLSKGNQQKIQFIAAVLHDPQVLLMDEPFTGLDPVNVMLLREAFLELRDRGRTVVFSTHQMEVAEALCESVAIVDRGRIVVGGPLRDVRRATGRRLVRISVEGDHRMPWLADVPGTRIIQVGMDRSAVELEPGHRAGRRARGRGRRRGEGHPLRARRSQPRAGVHRLRRPAGGRGDPPRAGRGAPGGRRTRTDAPTGAAAPRTRRDDAPHAMPAAPPEGCPGATRPTSCSSPGASTSSGSGRGRSCSRRCCWSVSRWSWRSSRSASGCSTGRP